jgi:hypothetical protein
MDRLKEWELVRSKNELAYFCPPWLPIAHNATHWDFRAERGFQRSLHLICANLRNLRLILFRVFMFSRFRD